MTQPTDPSVIGMRLTEAQREALLHPSRYMDPNTMRALRAKGLVASKAVALTEAGLAVRDYLLSQQGEKP